MGSSLSFLLLSVWGGQALSPWTFLAGALLYTRDVRKSAASGMGVVCRGPLCLAGRTTGQEPRRRESRRRPGLSRGWNIAGSGFVS